jgi:DNA-binding Xre family transcriptional regulator
VPGGGASTSNLPLWFWTAKASPSRIEGADAVDRFGENVRAARHARGWTQEELAHRTGLTSVQVSRIERGAREIRLTTLLRLLSALEASPDELLDGVQ